jgi:hypothetical protein
MPLVMEELVGGDKLSGPRAILPCAQALKLSYSQPAYLITTDLNTSSQELIQGYLNRWQIEVMHRELKQDVGVGEMQGWTENAVRRFHGALALMYGLVNLAGHRLLKSHKVHLS